MTVARGDRSEGETCEVLWAWTSREGFAGAMTLVLSSQGHGPNPEQF